MSLIEEPEVPFRKVEPIVFKDDTKLLKKPTNANDKVKKAGVREILNWGEMWGKEGQEEGGRVGGNQGWKNVID